MMSRYFSRAKAVVAAVVATLLCGCVPIPIIKSTELPPLATHVPEDLRTSDTELMVLTQVHSSGYSKLGWGEIKWRRTLIKDPHFVKGRDLESLAKSLKSEWEVNALFIVGAAVPLGGPAAIGPGGVFRDGEQM